MAAETMETNAYKMIAPVGLDFSAIIKGPARKAWDKMMVDLAAETEVMAATPTESTQLDTNRVTTAHKCIFTE